MKNFTDKLISELEEQLALIHYASNDPFVYSLQSVQILITALEKLKTYFLDYKFTSKAEEITFFREIKPLVASKLIYYNEIYNIAGSKPLGAKRSIRKYYANQIKRLNGYLDENAEFYRYYRTGSQYLDTKYFVRGKQDVRLTLDSYYLQADKRFSTPHDYTVAKILASDLLYKYLNAEIKALHNKKEVDRAAKQIKWTGPKVALVELIYALHSESVFNNGNASLNDTFALFQSMLNIDLGQFNRTFLEIRDRRSDRTKFLTSLINTLLLRMDAADEN